MPQDNFIFFSYLDSNYAKNIDIETFTRTFAKYHSEKLIIFNENDFQRIKEKNDSVSTMNWKAAFALELSKDYEYVVAIDTDHIIFSRLDSIFAADYDFAAPSNFNILENTSINCISGSWYKRKDSIIIPEDEYIQGGLVSGKEQFWKAYDYSCKFSNSFCFFENDILNLMSKFSGLKFKYLDGAPNPKSFDFKSFYGCSTLGLENQFYVDGDKVKLAGRDVAAYHIARGHIKPSYKDLFTKEVCDFIEQ